MTDTNTLIRRGCGVVFEEASATTEPVPGNLGGPKHPTLEAGSRAVFEDSFPFRPPPSVNDLLREAAWMGPC